jgi:hypothetical protein
MRSGPARTVSGRLDVHDVSFNAAILAPVVAR